MNNSTLHPLLSPGRFLAVLLLFAASLIHLRAEPAMGEFVGTLNVPTGISPAETRDIVIQSLAAREWTVKEKSGNRVVGYLKHRGNEATVTFLLEGSEIKYYCEGWAINKKGERKKPEQPKGWLGFLQKDINKRLNYLSATKS